MRLAYLDCASGISGDMMLGAIIDSGIPCSDIQEKIDSLKLPSCRLETTDVKRCGFRATKLRVVHEPEHAHRHLHHITDLIDNSDLTDKQRDLSKRIFGRIAESEAKVHGSTIEKVHFHEVGAVDSIADIVGCAVGLDLLNLDCVVASPIPTGSGFITIAHGRCSIPAPATAELLKNIPLADSVVEAELTTPTGAAIVATIASEFRSIPPMKITRIGYGAGDNDFKSQANILRLILGEISDDTESDTILTLETNLDDVSGEVIGHCFDQLLQAGALDVYATPIQMKKNRPAVKLSVLCEPSLVSNLEAIIFRETSTLGIRRWEAKRHKLRREATKVESKWGIVKGKNITLPSGEIRFSPEYESCSKLAAEYGVSVREVIESVTGRG